MIINNENNSFNHKEQNKTSLLSDIIIKVLLMRQQHLTKLDRESSMSRTKVTTKYNKIYA